MLVNKKLRFIFYITALFQLTIINTIPEANVQLEMEVQQKIKNGIPEWMLNQISQDLSLVPKSGITKEMIINTLQQDRKFLVLVKIKNGKIDLAYNDIQVPTNSYDQACLPIIAALNELNVFISLPDVEFVFSIDDAPNSWYDMKSFKQPSGPTKYIAPVFAACKNIHDVNVVLIPDYITLNSIKNNVIQDIEAGNTKYPWLAKKNKSFWRGATTGGFYRLHNYEQFPRVKLAKLSTDFPELIDAKFNYIWAIDEEIHKTFIELQYIGETVSISEHIQYKYQILIDGNSASWPRAYWQYQCNSVVFKQNSDYIVWHNELFKPWVHYIPFNYNCDDLIYKIKWAIDNDEIAQKIAENANNLAQCSLKYSDILVYFYAAITEYAKLQV